MNIKNLFLNSLKEEIDSNLESATFIIGRFQPFTNGHLFLIKEAKKLGYPVIVAVVKGAKSSQDKSKNPFPYELQKKMIIKGSGGLVKGVIEIPNAFVGNWVPKIREMGYEPKYWMVGEDRVKSYQQMVDKTKEKLNFDIEVKPFKRVSAGDDEEDISATRVRKALKTNDEKLLKKLVPFNVYKMKGELKKYLELSEKKKNLSDNYIQFSRKSKNLDNSNYKNFLKMFDWNQVKKNILEMKHIWELSKKGEEFIENLLNKEVIIQQKLDGSAFGIEWDGKKLHYLGGNNKKIGHRTRASIILYEPIIEHLEKQNLSLLPKTIITGEYFPKGLKPLIPIKIYPKNSWVIFSASHTNNVDELNKIANILNVEGPPIIFKGRLNATQKSEIMNFIYMNEEERISRFKTQSFAKFILELINPSFKFKINDEILEGVVFDFQGETPMKLKMVDPLFTSKIKSKQSEDNGKAYLYIIKDITIEFLNSHFEELKTMTAFYANEDDHEIAFISLVNDFLMNNLQDLSQYKKRVLKFKSRPGDLGKLFELNPKYVNPKLMDIVRKEFWIGDIYKLILGHFYSPKRRAAGIFNTQDLERINKIVNIIQYNLQTRS